MTTKKRVTKKIRSDDSSTLSCGIGQVRQVGGIRIWAFAMLRSKGLKDATCVGWFGDDWDCSVGSPPEAMGHVSSAVPVGYAV